jgi:SAM-dependent methyltransferase
MVFADSPSEVIYEHNKCDEGLLAAYYRREPVYTVAYYDDLLRRMTRMVGRTNYALLEFGCGSGMLLRRARRVGVDARGIDYSPYAAKARDLFGLAIENCDLDDASFAPGSFDVVVSHATFEHLANPLEVGSKLVRLLRPGGLFVVSGVPNHRTASIRVFRNYFNNEPPGHVNFFDTSTMRLLLEKLLLSPVAIRTYGVNVWYVMDLVRRLRRAPVVDSTYVPTLADTEYMLSGFDRMEPTPAHSIVSRLYCALALPGMGLCLEAWARK